MVQSLRLGAANETEDQNGMRRLNRLPIIVAIVIVALFVGVVVIGLAWRGLPFNRNNDIHSASNTPATNFGDQLKRGVTDGIIGEPVEREAFQPTPAMKQKVDKEPTVVDRPTEPEERRPRLETEEEWKARLKREQDEQIIREVRRQRMARLQARATALDSPLKVDISDVEKVARNASDTGQNPTAATNNASDLYAAAMKSGIMGENLDPNAQASKEDFFNQDIKDVGYLPNRVVPQMSVYELKRGSVIPATLITASIPTSRVASQRRSARMSMTAPPATGCLSRRAPNCSGAMTQRSRLARSAFSSSGPISFSQMDRPCRLAVWLARTPRAMVASRTRSTGISGALGVRQR